MPSPPIILIHRGDSFYLAHTIAQARSSNPESRLILLGDRSNSFYLGVEHHRYEDYFEEAREFAKLFTYEYFPNYQYPWILFCHQKYFALRGFIRARGIDKFLLIDSDVMVYDKIAPYFDHYKNTRMTVSGPPNVGLVHAAFSVVNDSTVVDDLCRTYLEMFNSSASDLQSRTGICLFYEMVGLHALSKRSGSGLFNTYGEEASFAISHSVLEDPLFAFDKGMVALCWRGDIPHLFDKRTLRWRRSPALHFHGKGKYMMGKYLKLSSGNVRCQNIANRTVSALGKYPARWMGKLGQTWSWPKSLNNSHRCVKKTS
jgi:hypothetical protein